MNKIKDHISLYPFQWEVLMTCIVFKVSNGLCLDISRLIPKDWKQLENDLGIREASLRAWIKNGVSPTRAHLDNLVNYVADITGCETLKEFTETVDNERLLNTCPNCQKYQLLKEAEPHSRDFARLTEIKTYAYERVLTMAKNNIKYVAFRGLHKQEKSIKQLATKYQIFKPGQIPPTNFKDVYVGTLEISEEGEVTYRNAYIYEDTKIEYFGNAIVKDNSALQILLFLEKNDIRVGFEYAISVLVNRYGITAENFPGITLGFDGNGDIYSYPVLLTTDYSLTITSPFVKNYFNSCYEKLGRRSNTGRLECQDADLILKLKHLYLEKPAMEGEKE
jgi:hypothetical protein